MRSAVRCIARVDHSEGPDRRQKLHFGAAKRVRLGPDLDTLPLGAAWQIELPRQGVPGILGSPGARPTTTSGAPTARHLSPGRVTSSAMVDDGPDVGLSEHRPASSPRAFASDRRARCRASRAGDPGGEA